MKKGKPTPGHRCKGAVLSVHVNCECGWTSANWSGSGARKNAYAEWRHHVEHCQMSGRSMGSVGPHPGGP